MEELPGLGGSAPRKVCIYTVQHRRTTTTQVLSEIRTHDLGVQAAKAPWSAPAPLPHTEILRYTMERLVSDGLWSCKGYGPVAGYFGSRTTRHIHGYKKSNQNRWVQAWPASYLLFNIRMLYYRNMHEFLVIPHKHIKHVGKSKRSVTILARSSEHGPWEWHQSRYSFLESATSESPDMVPTPPPAVPRIWFFLVWK